MIMLEKIRHIIDLEVQGDADQEQLVLALNMIADFKAQHHYLPEDIADWEDMIKYNYPQL